MDIRNIKAYVYWDFDDVLGRTNAQLVYLLKYIFGVEAPLGSYLTVENTQGRIDDLVATASFMRNTAFDYPALNCLRRLQEQFPHVQHGLATHRGYHPKGEEYTLALLNEYEVKLDSHHFIDPAVHGKDKMVYLRARHPPDDVVILIDDNTFYEHDAYPNSSTVLVDRSWNQHVVTTSPELRVQTSGIYEAVEALLCLYCIKAMTNERAT